MGPDARRHAETTDFAQEMMVEMLRALPTFELRDEAAFWTWLVTIARNRIGQVVRRHREHRFLGLVTSIAEGSGGVGDPLARAAREDDLQAMAQALEAMPDDRRRVIELRDLDGQSYREIGATLGRTENAVQILHARALAELARRLEP